MFNPIILFLFNDSFIIHIFRDNPKSDIGYCNSKDFEYNVNNCTKSTELQKITVRLIYKGLQIKEAGVNISQMRREAMTTTKDTIHIQLYPFLLARKNFYQILHTLFLEPAKHDLLFDLKHERKFSELKELLEGGRILADFFEDVHTKEKVDTEREEYCRLFIGPGALVAPPWESYYRSKDRLLFEEWTLQIREIYHQFGLQSIRENKEPDDHLLLEFEFMIFLIELSLQASETEKIQELISSQIHFLKEHLTIWIPEFCKRVIDHTTSRLYLGAAMLLVDFLNFDLTSLLEIEEALENV
jgi:putative dimethyl sulfoxide reductase chaperone